MTPKQLAAIYQSSMSFGKEIALCPLNASVILEAGSPNIMLEHEMIFVMHGSLTLEMEGKNILLSQYSYTDIDDHVVYVKFLSASNDFKGYILGVTQNFIVDSFKTKIPWTSAFIKYIRKYSSILLDVHIIEVIKQSLDSLGYSLKDNKNESQEAIIRFKLIILCLEIANYFNSKQYVNKETTLNVGRKVAMFNKFLNLIKQNAKTKHSVGFYADKLNITPQYLCRIVKNLSGKTVSENINEEILLNIKGLLSNSELTIKQISDEMHFAEPSVLIKFFKRYMEKTPLQYRKDF